MYIYIYISIYRIFRVWGLCFHGLRLTGEQQRRSNLKGQVVGEVDMKALPKHYTTFY